MMLNNRSWRFLHQQCPIASLTTPATRIDPLSGFSARFDTFVDPSSTAETPFEILSANRRALAAGAFCRDQCSSGSFKSITAKGTQNSLPPPTQPWSTGDPRANRFLDGHLLCSSARCFRSMPTRCRLNSSSKWLRFSGTSTGDRLLRVDA